MSRCYGTIPSSGVTRNGRFSSKTGAGAAGAILGAVALAGMVLLSSRSGTVLEGKLATTYAGGDAVTVPSTFVK